MSISRAHSLAVSVRLSVAGTLTAFLFATAGVTWQVQDDTPVSLGAVEKDGTVLVSITALAEAGGLVWSYDAGPQILVVRAGADSAVFSAGMQAVRVKDSVTFLSQAPVRSGGLLYASGAELAPVLASLLQKAVLWDARNQRFVGATEQLTLTRLERKPPLKGTTVVELTCARSQVVNCSCAFPYVTIELPGAVADTGALRAANKIGVTDSVSAVKTSNGVTVTVVLNSRIHEPTVTREQSAVRISLRARGEDGKVIPDSVLFGASGAGGFHTVVIDPGHGGKDPGCIGPGGIQEKDITLAIGLKVRDLLKKSGSFNVKLTRDSDVYVKLRDRTKMANDWKADLFISIHANAISGSAQRKRQVKGYKVYFLSSAKNEEDKLAAMRENAVVDMEDTPEEYNFLKNLVTDLVGNEYLNESQDFSILLSETFEKSLKKIPKLHLGVGQAPFWVLNGAYMPSVLIETGFISNPVEEKLLTKAQVQDEIARAVQAAVVEFSSRYEETHE